MRHNFTVEFDMSPLLNSIWWTIVVIRSVLTHILSINFKGKIIKMWWSCAKLLTLSEWKSTLLYASERKYFEDDVW